MGDCVGSYYPGLRLQAALASFTSHVGRHRDLGGHVSRHGHSDMGLVGRINDSLDDLREKDHGKINDNPQRDRIHSVTSFH